MNTHVQDYTHLVWSSNPTNTDGTGGAYLKAVDKVNNNTMYYKMSLGSVYQGIIGHESVNEYIVHRLLTQMDIPHLPYKLINALVTIDGKTFITPITQSAEFKHSNETKMTLESWIAFHALPNEEPYQTLLRYGFGDYLDMMFFVDFLVINRDRHGANVEMLQSSTGSLRIAPLFDNGVSFVAPLQNNVNAVAAFDVMQDVQVNNFVGRQSLQYNLRLIQHPVRIKALTDTGVKRILSEVQPYLPPQHIQKIYEIIARRYTYVKNQKILYEK